ncbi:hypothetical protein V6N13_002129 [Hibiscus sabdariffa]
MLAIQSYEWKPNDHKPLENINGPGFKRVLRNQQDDWLTATKEMWPAPDVHKQGSLVGRSIDLSRLYRYKDLMNQASTSFSKWKVLLAIPIRGGGFCTRAVTLLAIEY